MVKMKDENKMPDLEPEIFPDRRIKISFESLGNLHSFKVQPWLLYVILLIIVIGIIFLFVAAFRGPDKENLNKIHRLETENQYLQGELEKFNVQLDSINALLDSLRVKSAHKEINYPSYSDNLQPINKLLVHPALDSKLSAIEIKLEVIKNRLTYMDSNGVSSKGDELSSDALKNIPSILPTFGEISSYWGLRNHPILGGEIWHQGIDIANRTGTPVYATAEGIVSRVESDDGWGNVITIDHKGGYRTLYGHLYRSKVHLGDIVRKGQIIGLMGSTGMSTGSHLHYGVYLNGAPINPTYYLNRQDFSYYNMVRK